jgi:predicted nucleotidyltransferase component of viral defense system
VTGKGRNLAASVRERLRKFAASGSDGYQLVLQRFAIERLLFRLSESPRRDEFVLKGAVLLALWGEKASRVTRDLDLLGAGPATPDVVAKRFREILTTRVPPDGLEFPVEILKAAEILAGQEYVGVRLRLEAHLGKARIPLQVDVGFGDSVYPRPRLADYPGLLDAPTPRILVYPREAVIAEKLHAMVRHGEDNTRAKDFYDVFVLSSIFAFDGSTQARAIENTFERRSTEIPKDPPIALLPVWYENPERALRWKKYLERDKLTGAPPDLRMVGARTIDFLWPPLGALAAGVSFTADWKPRGPWK